VSALVVVEAPASEEQRSDLFDCASRAWKAHELVIAADLMARAMAEEAKTSSTPEEEFKALASILSEARENLKGLDRKIDEVINELRANGADAPRSQARG
jgi:hypothetical protein